MSEKVAAFIVNYNMPERTDALYKSISRTKWPLDIYVIDNASDIAEPSQYTNIWLPENKQTTGGWLAGLDVAANGLDYFAYWFLITSAEYPSPNKQEAFAGPDHLYPLAEWLTLEPDAVVVHPALTDDSTTHWKHMISKDGKSYRRTWMVDNIAALYRADWFDKIGRFDPALVYGWGIDLETCYLARKDGRSIWICEDDQIKKVTDIGYKMDRMNMTAGLRRSKASANMEQVLGARYGRYWHRTLENDYTDWR